MPRAVLVLIALACAVACGPKPAPSSAEPSSKLPHFAAAVGQLDGGSAFLAFIDAHSGQIVALDLQFQSEDYQGTEASTASTFDIWEQCDSLPEGQKPGALGGGCTGFEFTIPYRRGAPRLPAREGGAWRLRGRFRIEPAGGPLQGLMIVRLAPVPEASGGSR